MQLLQYSKWIQIFCLHTEAHFEKQKHVLLFFRFELKSVHLISENINVYIVKVFLVKNILEKYLGIQIGFVRMADKYAYFNLMAWKCRKA